MFEWVPQTLKELTWWQELALVVGTISVSLGGLAFVGWILVRLPADYFHENHHPRAFIWEDRHPLLRWTALIVKNLLGTFLVLLGIAMSLPAVPGPGILTIVIGLTMVDFPGKRQLELKLVERPAVRKAIDRMRERFGRPPLVFGPGADETAPPVDAPPPSS